jgi:hypothetical protein
MRFFEYTEKSIVVDGKDIYKYADKLASLGGSLNTWLKPRPTHGFEGGAGWIFSKRRQDKVTEFLDSVSTGTFKEPIKNPIVKESDYGKLVARIEALEDEVRKLKGEKSVCEDEDEDTVQYTNSRSLLRGSKK